MRVIRGEEKMLGAKELDRLGKLRLLGLDREVKVPAKIIAGRQLVLFRRNFGRDHLLGALLHPALAARRWVLVVVVDRRPLELPVHSLHEGFDPGGPGFGVNHLEFWKVVQKTAGNQRCQVHVAIDGGEKIESLFLKLEGVHEPVAVLDSVKKDWHIHLLGSFEKRPKLPVAAKRFSKGMLTDRISVVEDDGLKALIVSPFHLADRAFDVLKSYEGRANVPARIVFHDLQHRQVCASGPLPLPTPAR
jgi:hypothetical protein